jgi:hypothetical protein
MTGSSDHEWQVANQHYLKDALGRVRADLEVHIGQEQDIDSSAAGAPTSEPWVMKAPPAIESLCSAFRLTPFERSLLLLCAGVELDASFATLCAKAQVGKSAAPSLSLALAALPGAHWSALTPTAPLRYWKFIEVGPGASLMTSPLRIDERILHYLAGVSLVDDRLIGFITRNPAPADLPSSQRQVTDGIVSAWTSAEGRWPPVQLCGEEEAGLADVAAYACARLRLSLYSLRAADVPQTPTERETLLRMWTREAFLLDSALLLVIDGNETEESLRAVADFVERLQGAVIVASREPLRLQKHTPVRFDVEKPALAEQELLWHESLGPLAQELNGQIGALVSQFNLGRTAIFTVGALVRNEPAATPETTAARLWDTCRAQSRADLEGMAQRIETMATWEDLVLPSLQYQMLRDIVIQVRQRVKVYHEWGFAGRNSRGLGISALFAGPSGTGKTLAAEILAHELRLDLYRIDLSQVVSKYIGETEKNLRRVFDAAEAGGAVLLFDEADALFGKRSEVKDSHDRYANIEVSYLLQRMETYRGLAIMTTNMKQALDVAFTRRIRFILQFPFPDAQQRAEIWRRTFPTATPTEGLDVDRLARLNVTGGNIRNIALGAAFLAAEDGKSVCTEHLLRAARAEYAKIERPLTESEIAGWK